MRQSLWSVLGLAVPLAACNAANFGGNTAPTAQQKNTVTHQNAFTNSADESNSGNGGPSYDTNANGKNNSKTTTNQNSVYTPGSIGSGAGGGLGTTGNVGLAGGSATAGGLGSGNGTLSTTTTPPLSLTGAMDTFCFDDRSAEVFQGHDYDQDSTGQYSNAASSLQGNGVVMKFYKVASASDRQNPGTLVATVSDATIGKSLGQQLVSGHGSISLSLPQPTGLTPGSCYNILLCDSHAPQGACNLQATWYGSAQNQGNRSDDFSNGYLDAAQGWLDDNSQGANRGAIGITAYPVCLTSSGALQSQEFVILADGNSNQIYPTSCTDDNHISPLVIDFAGTGVTLTSQAAGVRFDLRGDKQKEQVSWPARAAAPGSACFVTMDRNDNGQIDDGTELFGNYTPSGLDGHRTANGFLALRSYKGVRMDHCADLVSQGLIAPGEDTSHYVCKGDDGFNHLRLWCDTNENGHTDAGELVAPATRGVMAFDTNYDLVHAYDSYCNETKQSSTVLGVDANGKTTLWHIFDVWFNVDASKKPPCG